MNNQRHWLGNIFRWLRRGVVAVVAVVLIALLLAALEARKMPELEPWLAKVPSAQFRAGDAGPDFSLADYLELEQRLFEEVQSYGVSADDSGAGSRLLRYVEDGPNNPQTFEKNWNRSVELVPDKIKGGVLLLHGLSDSPYSLRSLAEQFHRHGFYALCMRMPGHGTVVG